MMSNTNTCVGIDSDQAGLAPGCKGCPNASICSSKSNFSEPDQDLLEISRRLNKIKHIFLIISGKGGVGKTTVASNLARFLANNEHQNVGLLDIDICGPSIPRAMGIEGENIHMSSNGWSPIYLQDNLAVMSCGFLLESLDDAVIWRGPKKNGLIKQFLKNVDWNNLDFLLIDTPPGTSDEHLSIVNYLKSLENFKGALIITTPQEAALLDVRKQIDFCKKIQLKIIGMIENMCYFKCPNCKSESKIFKASTGGASKVCSSFNIPLLGQIPIDPIIGKSLDEGIFCYSENQISHSVQALEKLSQKVVQILEKN